MAFPPSPPTSTQPPADDSLPGGELTDQLEPEAAGLTLSPEQLQTAGLDQLLEGDTFSVRITGTVTSADGDLRAEITGASEGRIENAEPPTLGEPPKPSRMAIGPQSPKAAGFSFGDDEEDNL